MMWCIGRITAEYRDRMYGLLSLYARPYNAREPVVCVDEKSKQLLRQTRAPITVEPGRCAREDCEYRRSGTLNLFVAIEPKGKCRCVEVTARRTKVDFVAFVKHLVETVCDGVHDSSCVGYARQPNQGSHGQVFVRGVEARSVTCVSPVEQVSVAHGPAPGAGGKGIVKHATRWKSPNLPIRQDSRQTKQDCCAE
jgi:hypothetical protein